MKNSRNLIQSYTTTRKEGVLQLWERICPQVSSYTTTREEGMQQLESEVMPNFRDFYKKTKFCGLKVLLDRNFITKSTQKQEVVLTNKNNKYIIMISLFSFIILITV